MKNTTSRNIRQAFPEDSHKKTFAGPDTLKKSLPEISRTQRDALNYLVYMGGNCSVVAPSQDHIGKRIGKTRETVNRILKPLEDKGFVRSYYRHRHTCVYEVNPVLLGPWRFHFSQWLPALKGLLLISLLSLGFEQNVTPLKKKDKYISYRFGTYTHDYVSGGSRHHRRQPERYKKRSRKLVMHAVKQFYGENPFSEAIGLVAEVIPLTLWGKIKLSAFQDRVILNALKALLDSQVPIERPVLWLFKKCIEVSRSHKYSINWDWMKQLAIAHQMPTDQDLVLVRGNWTFKPEKTNKPSRLRKQQRETITPTVRAKINGRQSVEYRYIEPIADYQRFKEQMKDDRVREDFERAQRLLGWNTKQMLIDKVLALNLSNQELESYGLGELCQSSTSSPENLVPLSKEGELRQRSDHFSKSEKLSGMSPLKVSMETGHQSTSQSTWKPVSSSMTQLISTFQKNLFDDL